MKKILIVIGDMGMGGAQKSLVAFLQCLTACEAGEQYEVDLMIADPSGGFLPQIPASVRQIAPPKELRWLGSHLSRRLFRECFSWRGLLGECRWLVRKHLKLFAGKRNIQQRLWQCWRPLVPDLHQAYDVAISYMDGFPNYYVMDKVQAKKKVLWIHNEYQKLGYEPGFDRRFFDACDAVVTISQECRQCILREFPHCEEKVKVLENITVSSTVIARSEGTCAEFAGVSALKLLSVGRLSLQKGYPLAIGAAKLLKDAGVDFLWLVLGEGPEQRNLQAMIEENGLTEQFVLLGTRPNPYPYMKACDIFVQSSLFEGKSVVIDEAKILCKPIVATNYTTVSDTLTHGESGWIVDMTQEALFDGIRKLAADADLRQHLMEQLERLPKGNEAELNNYIQTMLTL